MCNRKRLVALWRAQVYAFASWNLELGFRNIWCYCDWPTTVESTDLWICRFWRVCHSDMFYQIEEYMVNWCELCLYFCSRIETEIWSVWIVFFLNVTLVLSFPFLTLFLPGGLEHFTNFFHSTCMKLHEPIETFLDIVQS